MIPLSQQRLLVIAPHPDDEVFGCGGLIRRVKQEGGEVYVLFLTVGTTWDFSSSGRSTWSERVEELERVADFLGYDGYRLAFPGDDHHLKLDVLPRRDLIDAIERGHEISLEALKPTMLLTPGLHDYNQDHWAVHEATIAATRPGAPEFKTHQPYVATYELPYSGWARGGPAEQPQFHVALTDADMDAKVKALELYASQLKSACGPLSVHGVRTLAAQRGIQCGARWAESFHLLRLVIPTN